MITLRGAGVAIDAPSFEAKHGLKPFMIAPTAIIRGVGRSFGFDLLDDVEGMTGYYDSNLEGKTVRAANAFLNNENGYEFGFVHVKATDDAGHDKDKQIKMEQLEKSDRALRKLVEILGKHAVENPDTNEYILCVTGDHTTPVEYGDHTFEPVPIAIGQISRIYADLQANKPAEYTFDEICCG